MRHIVVPAAAGPAALEAGPRALQLVLARLPEHRIADASGNY